MTQEFIEFVKTIGPILVGLAAIVASYILNQKMLKLKRNEDRIEMINRKLSEFYGPFQQYRRKSTELYKRFTYGKPNDFRTVTALLKGEKFSGNDEVLLKEIIDIGKKVENLILSKSGLIDDEKLRNDLLPRVGTHILLLRLMYEGVIKGESENEIERFKRDVFPREIDDEIEKRIQELEIQLEEIKS
ncbi:MAG: hypothetical protein PVH61_30720 [Candidatus Aminicenantes bacterium]|jgi:hypothetical protein